MSAWRHSAKVVLLAVLCVGSISLAFGQAAPGGAFNLRIVSDSVPDWSSRENFVRSALSGWETDHDKALAQFRWSYRGRRVGPDALEDGRSIHDPILFFNSYGITFCGQISALNVSLWETAGFDGRVVDVYEHVVAEVYYDGQWRLFDHDFCNFFLDENGAVAGGRALHEGRDKKPGVFWLFDQNPYASGPGGRIFMGPSSWPLSGVADWFKRYKPREFSRHAHAGHRLVLGLRPGESYVRFWQPLGVGEEYARMIRGKDPAAPGGSVLRNSRANGRWTWRPDLTGLSSLDSSRNVVATAGGLRAVDPTEPSEAIFGITAGHVVTSLRLRADADPAIGFSVSGNDGVTWTSLDRGGHEANGLIDHLGEPIAGRVGYLLRAQWHGAATIRDLEITTITQINPRVLPALRLGSNEIVAVSDGHLEYAVLTPRLTADPLGTEFLRADGWQALIRPVDHEPTIRSTGRGELIMRITTPRDIRHLRVACTSLIAEPSGVLTLSFSSNRGGAWHQLRNLSWPGKKPYDERVSVETRDIPEGVQEVWLRFAANTSSIGLINIVAEAGYEPSGGFMPYDVVYNWEEFRGDRWIARTHRERVASVLHRYTINVGGSRPPRMSSIEIGPADLARTKGYGDALTSPPPERLLVDYRWRTGKRIGVGRRYTVSRPASDAYPDTNMALLTDGYIGLASYWGLENIRLSGEPKNKLRVGDLAIWPAGEELAVTVDLGRVRDVGGVAICAVQPNENVRYPEKMILELSEDGAHYREVGVAHWEDCFLPGADTLAWEGSDSPVYAQLPAGGIIDFKFHIALNAPKQARFVRVRLRPPAGSPAGVGLWELDIFDKMEKVPWRDRIILPSP